MEVEGVRVHVRGCTLLPIHVHILMKRAPTMYMYMYAERYTTRHKCSETEMYGLKMILHVLCTCTTTYTGVTAIVCTRYNVLNLNFRTLHFEMSEKLLIA